MKSAGFKQLECDKCIFIHHDEATKKFVLVGCEVDDLIITGNDAACIARLKKKLVDEYNVTDWERIASFLGVTADPRWIDPPPPQLPIWSADRTIWSENYVFGPNFCPNSFEF